MKTKLIIGFITIIIITVIISLSISTNTKPSSLDNFAKCLTEKGAKMYGTYWCGYCQNQKQAFGTSWEFINYIECSLPDRGGQTSECTEEGITGYPTWKFADGSEKSGILSLNLLEEKTGCQLLN